jgi:hypothetical protein
MPVVDQRWPGANLRERKRATATAKFEIENEVLFAEAIPIPEVGGIETF